MTGASLRPGLPRALEAGLAALGLVLLAPLLALLVAAVRLSSPGPALFRQARMGRGGRPFTLLKLRTMTTGAPGSRVTAAGDARVTRLGAVLRRTKLDELPELWHVVRGDMSLVGPRPEVPELVELEDPLWRQVLEARPGLTDPVTLRLRDEEAVLAELAEHVGGGEELESLYRRLLQPFKLRGYADYLSRRSAWGDLGVLMRTVVAILDPASVRPPSVGELVGRGEA